MADIDLIDACVFVANASGVGDFVVGSPAAGWRTPAEAGAVNGATYRYRAYNFNQAEWEVGTGVYTSSTQTLSRDIVLASAMVNPLLKMDFTSLPSVAVTVFAEDFVSSSDFLGMQDDITAIEGELVTINTELDGKVEEAPEDGNQYVREDGDWALITQPPPATYIGDVPPASPVIGQLWFESDSGDTYIWYDDGNTSQWVQQSGGSGDGTYLPVTGGTLTGDLNIKTDSPELRLNGTAANDPAHIQFMLNDKLRWNLGMNPTQQFELGRFNAAGVYQDTPLIVDPNNGAVVVQDAFVVNKGQPVVGLNRPNANAPAQIASQINFTDRWIVTLGTGEAESGGNAGSNFTIQSFSDSGAYIATPLKIMRSNGQLQFGTDALMYKSNPVWFFSKNASGEAVWVGGQTNFKDRWGLLLGNYDAESGSNAGSDFEIRSFNDAGVALATSLKIRRSDGLTTFGASVQASNAGNPSFQAISSAAAGIPFVMLQNATRTWQMRVEGATGALHFYDTSSSRLSIDTSGVATFAATPKAPTVAANVADTQLATTAFVSDALKRSRGGPWVYKSAAYTLVGDDAGRLVIMDNNAVLTIPTVATAGWQLSDFITVLSWAAGTVIPIGLASGVTLNSRNSYTKIGGPYGAATLQMINPNQWILYGDLVA